MVTTTGVRVEAHVAVSVKKQCSRQNIITNVITITAGEQLSKSFVNSPLN